MTADAVALCWVARGAVARAFVACNLLCFGAAAGAQVSDAQIVASAAQWLRESTDILANNRIEPLRLEVSIGNLDSRLRLAPCDKVEPYLPPGVRLWGASRVGVRCLQGQAKWNVFLPVTVRAFGLAWVLRDSLAVGTVITAKDVMQAQVDWAQETASVLADPSQWLGMTASRPLQAGQALRAGMVKPAQVFQAGSRVRLVAHGSGFEIAADGQAMSTGVVGQAARVQMDNGRVMTGTVVDTKTVAVEL